MIKLKIILHFFLTKIFYRPFAKKMGRRVIICNPILITPKNISFGSNIFIRHFSRLEGVTSYQGEFFNPEIIISDGVGIEQNLHLTCAGKIFIGKNVAIAANVTISDIIHPYSDINLPSEAQKIKVSPVIIGEGCKLYNNVVILPGTHLGKQCIVGANTVVKGEVYPDYSVIVGSPGRIVKRYSMEKQNWIKSDNIGNF
jgi:acetyltransferase-like isoleucine patch superfamily enzyme